MIFLFNGTNSNDLQIKVKVQNEIITNFDIEHEKKYLSFLNPKLNQLDEKKKFKISKNSLITEIVKKQELKKFFNFEETNEISNIVEKNFLKKKNIQNTSDFIKILNEQELNYDLIKKKFQIEGLWNRLIYKKYSQNIKIDEDELKNKIKNQFDNQEKKYEYNLSEIVFTENINENLEQLTTKINKNINDIGFENTANIYSISSTSKNGGLIGWVNELQISSRINNGINKLMIGEVSEPIEISGGYLIIKINDKKEFKQKINLNEQLEKLIAQETNRQFNNFSTILYKRLKKNLEINEY